MIIKGNPELYTKTYKIISLCPKNKNIIKKFYNENDIKNSYLRWDYVFQRIMDLHEYGNHKRNDNIEKNLIYLLNIISKDEKSKKYIINFYKRIRYNRGDCNYEYILDDMPDLEIRFIYLVKEELGL